MDRFAVICDDHGDISVTSSRHIYKVNGDNKLVAICNDDKDNSNLVLKNQSNVRIPIKIIDTGDDKNVLRKRHCESEKRVRLRTSKSIVSPKISQAKVSDISNLAIDDYTTINMRVTSRYDSCSKLCSVPSNSYSLQSRLNLQTPEHSIINLSSHSQKRSRSRLRAQSSSDSPGGEHSMLNLTIQSQRRSLTPLPQVLHPYLESPTPKTLLSSSHSKLCLPFQKQFDSQMKTDATLESTAQLLTNSQFLSPKLNLKPLEKFPEKEIYPTHLFDNSKLFTNSQSADCLLPNPYSCDAHSVTCSQNILILKELNKINQGISQLVTGNSNQEVVNRPTEEAVNFPANNLSINHAGETKCNSLQKVDAINQEIEILPGVKMNKAQYFEAVNASTMRKRSNAVLKALWPLETRLKLLVRKDKRFLDGEVLTDFDFIKIMDICLALQSIKKLEEDPGENLIKNIKKYVSDFLKVEKQTKK